MALNQRRNYYVRRGGEIMRSVIVAAALVAAMLLAGCAGGQDPRSQLSNAPDIGITHGVWDAYTKDYLGEHTPLAFAVSENGEVYFYYYCEAIRCINLNSNEAITRAISGCQNRGQGQCVLFAAERSPPRKHHFIDGFSQRLKSP